MHDGDTLRARVAAPNAVVTDTESTRVRLIGLDTPEISPDRRVLGRRGDDEPRPRCCRPARRVWAAPDREVLDQYGRHLLYLWTPDGTFVNAELVAQGDGAVMVFAPNTLHEALFRSLEAEAVGGRARALGRLLTQSGRSGEQEQHEADERQRALDQRRPQVLRRRSSAARATPRASSRG